MSHRVIVMWTVPRSVSTSFERMISARGDHTVFDEPFSRSYYYGPDRVSSRYGEDLPDSSSEDVVAALEKAAHERPVFVKDMAYHAANLLGPDLLKRFDNCFLVRDPAATIRSLAKRWPDFTDDESGWRHLDEAVRITDSLGQPRVVLDADLLCRDPETVVAEWCRRMSLPYDPDALTWDAGMRPEWDLWDDWHASTARSTGFTPLDEPPPPPTPDEVRLYQAYQEAVPVYRTLAAEAIGGPATSRGRFQGTA
jgi:hypothetical protein